VAGCPERAPPSQRRLGLEGGALRRAGSLERQSQVPRASGPNMSSRCFTQAAAVRKRPQLRPACHVPPGVSLWAKGLPDCRCVIRRVQSCAQASDSRDFSTAMISSPFISSRALQGMVTRMRRTFCQKQRQLPSACRPALLPHQGGFWRARSHHRRLAGRQKPLGSLQAWLRPSCLQVQVLVAVGPEEPSPVGVPWLSL